MGDRTTDTRRIAIIAAMGVVTYLIRVAPQIFLMWRNFPEALDRYLYYLAYAMIASIIAISLFLGGHQFEAAPAPGRAVALLAAMLISWRSGSAVLGMLAGASVAVGLPWIL